MTPTKDGFSRQMSQAALPRRVIPLLSFKSVERFAMKYGKEATKRGYLGRLSNTASVVYQ
jgi:hypothetical protein